MFVPRAPSPMGIAVPLRTSATRRSPRSSPSSTSSRGRSATVAVFPGPDGGVANVITTVDAFGAHVALVPFIRVAFPHTDGASMGATST